MKKREGKKKKEFILSKLDLVLKKQMKAKSRIGRIVQYQYFKVSSRYYFRSG